MRIIRYEFKYFIDEIWYKKIMNEISHYLVPDPYAAKLPGYRYMVNSLYLDSPSKMFYDEKMAGIKYRRKVRMRCYSSDFYSAKEYYLEIKKRDEFHIDKIRYRMSAEDFNEFMLNNFYSYSMNGPINNDSEDSNILEEIIYDCNRLSLAPATFILYDREAYIAENDDTVRVTFDRRIRSQRFFSRLSPATIVWHSVFPGQIVLEIKVRTFLPFWLHNLVKKYAMQYESISKYCGGVDICQLVH
jgi:hypothetical protein